MLLGNLSANITGPGGGEMVLHADQLFVPRRGPPSPRAPTRRGASTTSPPRTGRRASCRAATCSTARPGPTTTSRAVPFEAPAGTLVVFESRLWHRTGYNRTTDQRRAGVFGWYTRPIYRTQENWFLSLDPSVRQFASDDLSVLLGYRTAGLGLVNGASPA